MTDENQPAEDAEQPRKAGEPNRVKHPAEEGEQLPPSSVPEDESVVPNRHSASAEAALLRWQEQHDED